MGTVTITAPLFTGAIWAPGGIWFPRYIGQAGVERVRTHVAPKPELLATGNCH